MKYQWKIEEEPQEYNSAIRFMESVVQNIIDNKADNLLWILEHLDVYTKGTSAEESDLLNKNSNIPILQSNRGGKWTYHGIGQRVVYPIVNLSSHKNIHQYIEKLEQLVILILNDLNIDGFLKKGLVGVWVLDNNLEKKIASLGIRIRKWVVYHGISINVNPDLKKFNNIIPCGINNYGITSIEQLGVTICYKNFDALLKEKFRLLFDNY